MGPAVVALTGASGAGKTKLVSCPEKKGMAGVVCISCDQVKLDLPKNSSEGATLEHWVRRVRDDPLTEVAVLDTQIRPHVAREILSRLRVDAARIVLVDCMYAERHERLRVRGQHELVNGQMDCWAAYLRGQADALYLPVIDTTATTVAESVARLGQLIIEVLVEVGPSKDSIVSGTNS